MAYKEGAGSGGGGLTNVNFSAGTLSQLRSNLTFGDSNGVSFGLNTNGVLTGTVRTDYLTVQSVQPAVNGISAGTTSTSGATVRFADSNGVSWGLNGSVVTATVATNYLTSQSNQAYSAANGSATFQTLSFANSNGVSFSTGTQGVFATVQTNYLTTARASNDAIGLNSAFTAGPLAMTINSSGLSLNAGSAAGTSSGFSGNLISGSMTHNTAGLALSLNHPAWLTTARASNDAVGLATAQTNVTWTVNSAGLSLNAGGYAGTGTSATNASITLNSNGLAISVAAPGGGAAVNFSAGTTSNNLQTVVFSNSNGVSFGLNGSTMTASVAPAGGGNTLSYYQNLGALNGTQTMSVFGSTHHVQPFVVPYAFSASYIEFPVSVGMTSTSFASTASSRTGGFSRLETHNLVFYTRGTGASASSLQFIASTAGFLTWGLSFSIAANGTQASSTYGITFQQDSIQTNTQFSSSQSQTTLGFFTNNFSNFSAGQFFAIPLATSFSQGQYWMAYCISTSSSTNGFTTANVTNWSLNRSFIAVSQVNSNFNRMGSTTNSSNGIIPGLGSWTTNAFGATTSSINLANVSTSASGNQMFFRMIRAT